MVYPRNATYGNGGSRQVVGKGGPQGGGGLTGMPESLGNGQRGM